MALVRRQDAVDHGVNATIKQKRLERAGGPAADAAESSAGALGTGRGPALAGLPFRVLTTEEFLIEIQ